MVLALSLAAAAEAVDEVTTDPGLAEACGERPSLACEWAWELTHNQLAAKTIDWFVSRPLAALVVLGITWVANRVLRRLTHLVVTRFVRREEYAAVALGKIGVPTPSSLTIEDPRVARRAATLSAVARASVSAFVWSVGVLMVLGIFNINLAPLLAGAGIAGITIGLGAQSVVRDSLAGFFILLEDQFGVGDEVDLALATGMVELVTLRSTTVRGADGTQWTVPNGSITRAGNHSRQWSRAILDVTIPNDADLDAAEALLQRVSTAVCEREENAVVVLAQPTVLGVERLTADGVVLRIAVRTTPGAHLVLMRTLRAELLAAFAESGVTVHQPPVV